eukprot:g12189.t1
MATSGDLEHGHRMTSDETVVAELNGKLLEWQACKTVKEYFDIPYRNPFKKQVQDPVLNRFGGSMGPYEDSLIENIPGVRYINATEYPSGYLPGTSTEFNYIATMCPKLETFEHFWLMVWAKNTRIIVNLTNAKDRVGSKPSDKKERYWPPYRSNTNTSEQSKFWRIRVETLMEEEASDFQGLWKTLVRLSTGNSQQPQGQQGRVEERYVTIYSYTNWVDFGRAKDINRASFRQNAKNVMRLLLEVEKHVSSNNLDGRNDAYGNGIDHDSSYIVVHCSAGVGRTGTYITLARILHEYEKLKLLDQHIPFCDRLQTFIFQIIQHLRCKRLWMVKTEFEYATLFASLSSFADKSGISTVTWPSSSTTNSFGKIPSNSSNAMSIDTKNDSNVNNDDDIAQYDFQND